jgi:dTDP-glucose pyrophosphorylase
MSTGSTIPIDNFVGNAIANMTTANNPRPGIPVFDKPISAAPIAPIIHVCALKCIIVITDNSTVTQRHLGAETTRGTDSASQKQQALGGDNE